MTQVELWPGVMDLRKKIKCLYRIRRKAVNSNLTDQSIISN
jgi:hypothetical protein